MVIFSFNFFFLGEPLTVCPLCKDGDAGLRGEIGDPGENGEKGGDGMPGDRGDTGRLGEDGLIGLPGTKGEKVSYLFTPTDSSVIL